MNIKIIVCIMIGALHLEASALKYDGGLRLGVQYHDSQERGRDMAMGGYLHADTRLIEGVEVGMTLGTTQVLLGQNDALGVPYFGAQAQSYALLQEAYVKASYANTTFILGRQILDTPFLDSDDIGMMPNRFEAFSVQNHDVEDIQILYSYVRRMAGVDASVAERFTRINGDRGVHLLGLMGEKEAFGFSAWVYALPDESMLFYVDGSFLGRYEGFSYTLLAQGAWENFEAGKSSKILGFALEVEHAQSPFSLQFAYDTALDARASNGFGGGPFFANDEHMTLAEVGADGAIMIVSVDYEVSDALEMGVALSDMRDKEKHHGYEIDVRVGYAPSERVRFDAIYSTLDNQKISDDKFDNLRLLVDYSF